MEKPVTIAPPAEMEFKAGDVTIIASGHFIHDLFTAFFAPLLPELIKILQISLFQAGTLSAIMQLPSLLNPFLGYLDDRRNLRWVMILAPGISATLMSLIGLAPNYASLVLLLLVAGVSISAFHSTAPARLARLSGNNIGQGMSFFMGGGELGRSVAPLVAVWGLSTFTISGLFPLSLAGWMISALLFVRFGREKSNQPNRRVNGLIPSRAWRFYIPATLIVVLRGLMISGISLYLPTLLEGEGASLWAAGSALALYQFAGTAGALLGGTLSDRFGRHRLLAFSMGAASLLFLAFLASDGWLTIPLLLCIGLLNLTFQPIMLALVQDLFPEHRSMANGIYMTLSFLAFSLAALVVGALGDGYGLRSAFFWCGTLSLLAVPLLLLLPRHKYLVSPLKA